MNTYSIGIDIGSTTVKLAILNQNNKCIFSDYQRHFANIQETLENLLKKSVEELGDYNANAFMTGSGGLSLSKSMDIPFVQEVVAVATALKAEAPHCDVAIELGGEDAKIIYFKGGID